MFNIYTSCSQTTGMNQQATLSWFNTHGVAAQMIYTWFSFVIGFHGRRQNRSAVVLRVATQVAQAKILLFP